MKRAAEIALKARCEIHRVRLEDFLRSLRAWRGTGWLTLGVVTYLATHPGQIVSTKELADWVYDGREDGGPLGAEHCVEQAICSLRHEGFPIENHHGRGFSCPAEL